MCWKMSLEVLKRDINCKEADESAAATEVLHGPRDDAMPILSLTSLHRVGLARAGWTVSQDRGIVSIQGRHDLSQD